MAKVIVYEGPDSLDEIMGHLGGGAWIMVSAMDVLQLAASLAIGSIEALGALDLEGLAEDEGDEG